MNEEKLPAQEPSVQPSRINGIIALLIMLVLLMGFQIWRENQPGPKWEYKIETLPDATFAKDMTALGADGWEMVFARRATTDTTSANPVYSYEMIFRRRVK